MSNEDNSGAQDEPSRCDPVLSPADEQEQLHDEIRASTARRVYVLAAWWIVAQVPLACLMCGGLVDRPDQRIEPLYAAGVLMCDFLVFAFAGAIAMLVVTHWSAVSMWTRIAGFTPLIIASLQFPLTCAGAFLWT